MLVLEPRRIAARMAARRVAEEMGEKPGESVGYQVRFEEVSSARTRLRFLTEGVLTRRMISDSELKGVGTVVLDEFHERHLETDLALALLRRLQLGRRPDLRIAVMSATLDAGPVARFLGDCPVLRSEGRLFELTVSHTPYSAAPLEAQVASAVEGVLNEPGDILVFLPGAAEIRRSMRACEDIARRRDALLLPLYGDLSPAEQDLAVTPADRRKIVFSTNIAESSITIDGVRVVIDSGLARIPFDSPWTGLPSLETRRISKASARQRAGRAGRTGPGRVIRLYTAEDFHRRPDHDDPEILRRELSPMCLQVDPSSVEWLDAPPDAAVRAARALLEGLDLPKTAARQPVHPRIARLLLTAEALGAGDHGCRVAALLSSGQRVQTLHDDPDQRTRAVYEQLRRFVKRGRTNDDDAIGRAILAAFPDRVARRGPCGVALLSNGKSAAVERAPSEFFVAIDVEDRVRLASPIEPEWLMDHVTERAQVEWNRQAERVEAVNALLYDELVIDETRGGTVDDEAAARLLAAKVMEAGVDRFVNREDLDAFLARAEFAAAHSSLPAPTEADVLAAMTELCYGLRSFADVEKSVVGLIPTLERRLDPNLLERIAPARLKLPSGRTTRVNYERGKPPWIASRLQDFFGLTETPRVAGGQVALVVHLLAPNQRAVQTTTDLAGFWQRLYPQLRRELGRRYPRHAWPEDPFNC